ncbi:MAG: glycosyltransferase family 2 protein [Desulfobacteraceae bacterium]|nr:glycosyltransferase family 2 protein [Desulfobacteraceae bacterium]MBU4055417.1 glycosyltransferase family 2 protein [Pseudomonadota bacterium]
MKASIIVSNYQGMQYLPGFFAHLMKQTYPNFEVIFVDAGSDDDSAEFVRSNYPDVMLIEEGRIGIGEAINIGIRKASGDILIFDLNTDEFVETTWLSEIVCHLSRFNFEIICGHARIIYGTSLIDEAGVNLNRLGQAKKIGHKCLMEKFVIPEKPVCFVGCPAFHRKLLDRIGMVDEEYFIYAEDLDFCFRAKLVGIQTRCAPLSRSYHHIRGTMGANPRRMEYFLRRANLRFHLIHSQPTIILLNWLYIAFFLTVSAFVLSFCSGLRSPVYLEKFKGRIEAVLWNLKNLNHSFAKRKFFRSILKKSLN